MAMISYAQNREDVILARVFTDPTGFYVDVGASDPVMHSVTKWFYDRGWTGVNIEPHTPTFERLASDRPRDANLNIAVSDAGGTFDFFEIPHTEGLHTLEPAVADKVRREGHAVLQGTVPCRTLADVCAWFVGDRAIDFMKIDAEGHERAVLAGMDFSRWTPRVLVVEATEPCSTVPSHAEWEPIVLEAGYRFAFFDGLNRYYVRQDESEEFTSRLAVPASVFDE
jgi:FkbM family methyltransferase